MLNKIIQCKANINICKVLAIMEVLIIKVHQDRLTIQCNSPWGISSTIHRDNSSMHLTNFQGHPLRIMLNINTLPGHLKITYINNLQIICINTLNLFHHQ